MPYLRGRPHPRNPGQVSLVEYAPDHYIKSLMHFNGVQGGTVFTDESGKVWTANGTAITADTLKKFGVASANFVNNSGQTSYITTPNHADFQLGSEDFTVELFWLLYAYQAGVIIQFFQRRPGGGNDSYLFQYVQAASEFRFNWTTDGTTFLGPASFPTGTITTNTWYHIALAREGANLRCFLDGVQIGSTYNIGSVSFFVGNSILAVGPQGASTAITYNTYFDEFRFTKGLARYTANFTPPTFEFGI